MKAVQAWEDQDRRDVSSQMRAGAASVAMSAPPLIRSLKSVVAGLQLLIACLEKEQEEFKVK